jgi:hypothetical protein
LQPLGSGLNNEVHSVVQLPNGDLIAGGSFTQSGAVPIERIARWNGQAWSAVQPVPSGMVNTLQVSPTGSLWVGGTFFGSLGELIPSCQATANAYGAGCMSSAGPVTLNALGLPWAGGNFQATASGVPNTSFVVSLYGFGQQNLSLQALLPQAGLGCQVLVGADIVALVLPTNGTASTSLVLPNAASVVGFSFYHQIGVLELDAFGTITAASSSNALALVVGAL